MEEQDEEPRKRQRTRAPNDDTDSSGAAAEAPVATHESAVDPSSSAPPKHDPSMAADSTSKVLVNNRSVGSIIGKQGSVIRSLREQSGARVNISDAVPMLTDRVVAVSGNTQQVCDAFAIIVRLIAGATGPSHAPVDLTQPLEVDETAEVEFRVLVPAGKAGGLIGKGGETITRMRNETKCHIQVSKPEAEETDRCVTLKGPLAAVVHAHREVLVLLGKVEDRSSLLPGGVGSKRPVASMMGGGHRAPPSAHHPPPHAYPQPPPPGSLVGVAGALSSPRHHAPPHHPPPGAPYAPRPHHVGMLAPPMPPHHAPTPPHHAPPPHPPPGAPPQSLHGGMGTDLRGLTPMGVPMSAAPMLHAAGPYAAPPLMGSPPGLTAATGGYADGGGVRVAQPSPPAPDMPSVQVQVPDDMMGRVIGKAGSSINEIRKLSNCRIDIGGSAEQGMRLVTITGTPEQAQMAQYMISVKMAGGNPSQVLPGGGAVAGGVRYHVQTSHY